MCAPLGGPAGVPGLGLPSINNKCMQLRRAASLTVLKRRYLQQNQLSGTIPSSLGNLVFLTFLCVRRAVGKPKDVSPRTR